MAYLRSLVFLGLLLCLQLSQGSATQVLPVNLEEMLASAGAAFIGICQEAKVEARRDERFPQGYLVTTYTFRVERWIKGDEKIREKTGNLFQFSQWGASKEESEKRGMPSIISLQRYEVGNEYGLFLMPPSVSTNLTSPVGLQAVFDVVVTPGRTKVISHPAMSSILTGLPRRPQITKAVGKMDRGETELPVEMFLQITDELKK